MTTEPQDPRPAAAPTLASTAADLKATATRLWDSAPALDVLLPLRAWWEGRAWTKGAPLLFLLFGGAPFVILQSIGPADSISKVAWSFSIYFAVMWALAMWAMIRPGRFDLTLVAKVAAASIVVGIPIAVGLERHLDGSSSLLTNIYGIGLPEEIAKALPVFVLMYVMSPRRTYAPRVYMYIGAISGLAFGVAEAVNYSKSYAGSFDGSGVSEFSVQLVWRLLCDGLVHACAAAVTCYFIGLADRNDRWRVQLIGFGLTITAVWHGFHDRWSDGYPEALIAIVVLFVFVGYVMSADAIESQVAEAIRSRGR